MTGKVDSGRRNSSRNAFFVGSGILLSRLIGLVRERIFAHYFGNTDPADAFKAALRIPNLLQNLFGEGALSSSFIPVYSRLLASGKTEEANRVSRVVGSILSIVVSVLVLLGILATPILIDLIAPGFEGMKRDFTIRMVRILFPGTGILVLSAWCLGILNSHRRFFLPYAAPVLWNAAMITTMIISGGRQDLYPFVSPGSLGRRSGQPASIRGADPICDAPGRPDSISNRDGLCQCARRNPQFPAGSRRPRSQSTQQLCRLHSGQLFAHRRHRGSGLCPDLVSASRQPVRNVHIQCRTSGDVQPGGFSRGYSRRLENSDQCSHAAGRIFHHSLGCRISGARRQHRGAPFPDREVCTEGCAVCLGRSCRATVGLLGATLGRLYTSAFWSLGDTRTPLRFAMIRVGLAAGFGWLLAFPVTGWLGVSGTLGVGGTDDILRMAAWVEFSCLRRSLNQKIGDDRTFGPLSDLFMGRRCHRINPGLRNQNVDPTVAGAPFGKSRSGCLRICLSRLCPRAPTSGCGPIISTAPAASLVTGRQIGIRQSPTEASKSRKAF